MFRIQTTMATGIAVDSLFFNDASRKKCVGYTRGGGGGGNSRNK